MARTVRDETLVVLYLITLLCVLLYVWNSPSPIPRSSTESRASGKDQVVIVREQAAVPVNVPTRGYYGDFHIVGYLQPLKREYTIHEFDNDSHKCNEKNRPSVMVSTTIDTAPNSVDALRASGASPAHKSDSGLGNSPVMLRLYGRQIDSQRFEYYTTNHLDHSIMITLHVPGERELSTDDIVHVPGYGDYRAEIYQPLLPSFI